MKYYIVIVIIFYIYIYIYIYMYIYDVSHYFVDIICIINFITWIINMKTLFNTLSKKKSTGTKTVILFNNSLLCQLLLL